MRKKILIHIFTLTILLFSSLSYAFDGYGVVGYTSPGLPEESIGEVFQRFEDAGVKWIRLGFRWDEMEFKKGIYVFDKRDKLVALADRHGIKTLGLISGIPGWAYKDTGLPVNDIEDWKRFVRVMVTHFKGKVGYWEVWNEPDIKKFWKGSPEDYFLLLKELYKVIKEVDPFMKVISAGLDGNGEKYIEKLLALGMSEYCDIIAFHPYGNSPEKSLYRVKEFSGILKKHNVKKPLWLTEIGWQTGGWQEGPSIAKDEETKALYLTKSFELLKPYTDAIFWYRAVEGPKMYGLMEIGKDGSLKTTPSYNAYKGITKEAAR